MKDEFVSWEEAVLWLRARPEHEALVRDCYYDEPLEESAARFYASTEWKAVQELLRDVPPGKALDVGAGRGISSYALARDGWVVTALEPDPGPVVGAGAIRRLAQDGLDITVVEDRGESLPFAEGCFDLVYGRAVLHHAADLDRFCREVGRVLRPGGLFLATREHVISRKADLPAFLDSHPLHALYGGEHAFLLEEYLGAMKKAGLRVRTVLAPYDSDINLFPSDRREVREKLSRRIGFTLPDWLVKMVAIPLLNIVDNRPGRLFSFVGEKP